MKFHHYIKKTAGEALAAIGSLGRSRTVRRADSSQVEQGPEPAGSRGAPPAEDFERELLRQRAYADRVESSFVFLSFRVDAAHAGKHEKLSDLLLTIVADRVRASDIVGWHGKPCERIGVILPSTTEEAVPEVVRAIESRFQEASQRYLSNGSEAPALQCEMMTYPPELTGAQETNVRAVEGTRA